MDHTHRAKQANDIPDPTQPVTGKYDENEIRVGALELVVARQRNMIRAQRDEIERLGHCIKALEREGIEDDVPYRGYKSYESWVNAMEHSERPRHFSRDGQIEN